MDVYISLTTSTKKKHLSFASRSHNQFSDVQKRLCERKASESNPEDFPFLSYNFIWRRETRLIFILNIPLLSSSSSSSTRANSHPPRRVEMFFLGGGVTDERGVARKLSTFFFFPWQNAAIPIRPCGISSVAAPRGTRRKLLLLLL